MRKILAVFLLCLFLVPARAEDERPSVALVLGGGAARGFAHIAVLELIEEMGIPIDMIAGVSSGAIVGGLYSAGYSPKMIMDAMEFRNWTSFFQDRPLPPYFNTNNNLPLGISIGGSAEGISPNWGRGYSSGQRVYELFKSLTVKIPSYMDFDELPIPFRAGAVEIPGGQFRFLKEGDLAEAIRASMSIQGVFEPFIIDGQSYTDGGLMNNVPIKLVREMGYDIVIAVDLFALPDEFSTAPLDLPDLLTTLYSSQTSRDQHGLADVVLFPLPSNVSATSFEKGREIYTLAKDKRDILASQLEPVLKMINEAASNETAPLNSEKKYAHTYENLPPIIPGEIFIKGELPRDRSLIKREYKKILKDNALGEKNVAAFLGKIYETGNYRMVTLRVQKLPSGEARVEADLFPMEEYKFLFRAGLDYEGTFSSLSSSRAALRSGMEFRGRKGLSLLFKTSILDELSAGLSLFRPLSPHFFVSAEADIVRDQEMIIKGILNREEIAPNRLLFFSAALKTGLYINRHNSFLLWPEYFWFRGENEYNSEAGIAAAYTFSLLNKPLFPSRGFRFKADNRLRFSPEDMGLFDIVSLDINTAIPFNRQISLALSGYGSMLFGETELPPELSTFVFEKAGRLYFPHAVNNVTGEKKAAVSISLQYEPRENLSLLGGNLIFFMTGAAGSFFEWNEWEEFGKDKITWNASLGTALIPINTIGLVLRGGAGGDIGQKPVPFISLDIGMGRFLKDIF